MATRREKKLKMTKALQDELLEVGVEEFCRRHGYSRKGHGLFTQFYRRLQEGKALVAPARSRTTRQAPRKEPAPSEGGPALRILIETNDQGKACEIMSELDTHISNLMEKADVRVEISLAISSTKGEK